MKWPRFRRITELDELRFESAMQRSQGLNIFPQPDPQNSWTLRPGKTSQPTRPQRKGRSRVADPGQGLLISADFTAFDATKKMERDMDLFRLSPGHRSLRYRLLQYLHGGGQLFDHFIGRKSRHKKPEFLHLSPPSLRKCLIINEPYVTSIGDWLKTVYLVMYRTLAVQKCRFPCVC